MKRAAWFGEIDGFLSLPVHTLLASLEEHSKQNLNEVPSDSQRLAWKNSAHILQESLREAKDTNGSLSSWQIIWEFELPRERGRRPDVLLLGPGQVWILEFKEYPDAKHAHLDQVAAYARDLANYHGGSHGLEIIPILIPARSAGLNYLEGPVRVLSPDRLENAFANAAGSGQIPDTQAWIDSSYIPLPSIVSAARRLFNNESLPQIRRAHSAGIPDALDIMRRCVRKAREREEHHLILITGVPGAGKTLAGLQFVYDEHLGHGDAERSAVFLSGNGPLVKVLQHALCSRTFVQDVHGFLRDYGGGNNREPSEHIWVYDEAQRAWDAERVNQRRGHPTSEPEDFLRIGSKKPWAVMLGLIGEGQEIHLGEESGLGQWNDALGVVDCNWRVTCPSRLQETFTNATKVGVTDTLDLTISLRTHTAEQSHAWVAHLLEGRLNEAAETANQLRQSDYALYFTRDMRSARRYAKERYGKAEDRRFGLVASSRASDLSRYGFRNSFQETKNVKLGPWYNSSPSDIESCCQLTSVVTEFSCQGLELDLGIVGWGNDLVWRDGSWFSKPAGRSSSAKNPHQLRINSYRVLLTRGRDGLVIFLPPTDNYDPTADALRLAGVVEIGTKPR